MTIALIALYIDLSLNSFEYTENVFYIFNKNIFYLAL